MCFEHDALPPLPPVSGGSVAREDVVLSAADGNTFAAMAAMGDNEPGSAVVVMPDVRGLYPFYEELAAQLAAQGYDAVAFDYFGRTAGVGKRDDDFPFMDHVEQTQNALSALQEKGVRIAIDDFGTGHSSLATLKRLPADTLKVDRAFVHDIPQDPNDMAIIRAILAMGRELGLYTVAEGVETAAQKDFLTEEGCHCFQGFFFARPLPAESVPQLWQQQPTLEVASR